MTRGACRGEASINDGSFESAMMRFPEAETRLLIKMICMNLPPRFPVFSLERQHQLTVRAG
jgi:hypothetical protein